MEYNNGMMVMIHDLTWCGVHYKIIIVGSYNVNQKKRKTRK